MTDNFTITPTLVGYSVIHIPSRIAVVYGITKEQADIAIQELANFDADCKPSEARLRTWAGACRRAIARLETAKVINK